MNIRIHNQVMKVFPLNQLNLEELYQIKKQSVWNFIHISYLFQLKSKWYIHIKKIYFKYNTINKINYMQSDKYGYPRLKLTYKEYNKNKPLFIIKILTYIYLIKLFH